jgi:hypothetical protein
MKKTYFDYRKQLYASINARKGNLMTLSRSKLLKKDELIELNKIIDLFDNLRIKINNNNFNITIEENN